MMKKEAAKYLKVSVPTLNKFIEANKGIIVNNLIIPEKLEQIISVKSIGNLKKGGGIK